MPLIDLNNIPKTMASLKQGYSMIEKKRILEYIIENNAYKEVKGRGLWVKFADSRVINRTWQSLKEVFIKRIYPDIRNPYYKLTQNQIKLFKDGFTNQSTIDWSNTRESNKSSRESSSPENSEPRALRPRLSQQSILNKSISEKDSPVFLIDEVELNTQKFNSSISKGTASTPKGIVLKIPTKTPIAKNPSTSKASVSVSTTSSDLNHGSNSSDEMSVLIDNSDDEIADSNNNSAESPAKAKNSPKIDLSKNSAKRNIFGLARGQTTVVEMNHINGGKSPLKHKSPKKLATPVKTATRTESALVKSSGSEASDKYVQLKYTSIDSVRQPLFALYNGELHPLYVEKNNMKLKCFFKNQQLQFIQRESTPIDPSPKLNIMKEKLSGLLNNDATGKQSQLTNGDILSQQHSSTKKYLNNSIQRKDVIFSESPKKTISTHQKVVDFPNDAIELQYYKDIERYLQRGCRGRKPMKESYQRLLTEEEKRKHKKYAHLYENQISEPPNTKRFRDIYKKDEDQLQNDILLKEIQALEEVDAELSQSNSDKNDNLLNLKYLIEKKRSEALFKLLSQKYQLASPMKNFFESKGVNLLSPNSNINDNKKPAVQPKTKTQTRPLLKDSMKPSPKKAYCLKLAINDENNIQDGNSFKLDTQNADRILNIIENLNAKKETQPSKAPSDKSNENAPSDLNESQKDEEIMKLRQKENSIFKTLAIEKALKTDMERRNLFSKSEIELTKNKNTSTKPYFVASDAKKSNENSNEEAERTSVISDMQKTFNREKITEEKSPLKKKSPKAGTSKMASDDDSIHSEKNTRQKVLKAKYRFRDRQPDNNQPPSSPKTKKVIKKIKVEPKTHTKIEETLDGISESDKFMLNPQFDSQLASPITFDPTISPTPKPIEKRKVGRPKIKIQFKTAGSKRRLSKKSLQSPPKKKTRTNDQLENNNSLMKFGSYDEIYPGFVQSRVEINNILESFKSEISDKSDSLVFETNLWSASTNMSLTLEDMSLTPCVADTQLEKRLINEDILAILNSPLQNDDENMVITEQELLTSDESFMNRSETENKE